MSPLTIHRNLLDAINVLYEPFIPCDTPADLMRNRAARYLKSQLAVIEAPIIADDFFECGCGDIVAVGDDHQCAYIEACAQEDEQSRNYAQRTM